MYKLSGALAGSATINYSRLDNLSPSTGNLNFFDQDKSQGLQALCVKDLKSEQPYDASLMIYQVVESSKKFFKMNFEFTNMLYGVNTPDYFDKKNFSVEGSIGENVLVRMSRQVANNIKKVYRSDSSPFMANVEYDPAAPYLGVDFLDDKGLSMLGVEKNP